ncbi:MAG: cyanophycin synthetase [Candidatus Eisenbacteria bacterium]|uniref:Cyanophycin synthetase n=1 Tax=Eiseniibacteriota bacterium TaxID=2212470 RepID=A0A538U4C9_UNCEI|nr:MAG: cyanophycin synthetase [Candidatus Eisenbacteria bacterium]
MKLLDSSVYLGPSIYAHFPVIRLTIDLGELEQWPSVRLGRGFIDALLDALPGLREHGCSYGAPGGFVRRLTEEEGTWLGHVLEHVAIELQNEAGAKVTFGKTREGGRPGTYDVVFEYEQAEVGLEAAQLGMRFLHSLTQRRALGPSTAALVRAAEERDIPVIRLNNQSLVQFGHARYQRRIQATITSETRHIAVEIASDKEETHRILSTLGLPVPQQRLVYTEEDAAMAAQKMGFPVVVKPYNGNHGRGVSLDLRDGARVRAAFQKAREISRAVVIESFVTGRDYRMLVVNGRMIAVAERVPGRVIGDGVHTVAELVEITNQDPRRGIGHEKVLTRLELDTQAERCLADHDSTRDSVPGKDEIVPLRLTGNLSTGGTAIDVTDIVHPDNIEMAVRAIRAIGLDVGGVDFIAPDIRLSYREAGGAICEVNAAPGFRMHVAPSEGTPRDVAGPVMDMLFPPGTPARIPIATITGTNGKTTTARMVGHVLKLSGRTVGLTTTDGVYINGQLSVKGDMTGPVSARMVLRDPSVEMAVLETARGGILRRGLGYRKCSVGAVLNIQSDHLGLKGVETLDQLAEVKRVVVEVATDTAVLNADDPRCLRMADHTQAKHVCYVTQQIQYPLVKQHIRAGGRACALEEGVNGHMITLFDRGLHLPVLWTHAIPSTLDGRAAHNVQNAMFAAAIAYAMGVQVEDIRQGLRTFDTTFELAPGRTNVYDRHPFKVIMDYGHNAAAVRAMCELTDRMEVRGRRICVLSAPGDRRDEDIAEIGRTAAGHFDEYLCRRDDGLRGRKSDEVPRILRSALLEEGVPSQRIDVIPEEQEAVNAALHRARPGDLLLVFADALSRTWNQVVHFQSSLEEAHPPVPATVEPGGDGELDERLLIRDERGVRLARETENTD